MRMDFWRIGAALCAAASIEAFAAAPAGSPVDIHGALRVAEATINGKTQNTIVNQTGKPTQLAGMSLFWSGWAGQFYNRRAVASLAKDWNMSIVRVALGVEGGGNYLDSANNGAATNIARADTVIQTAIDHGLYVIIDWHDHYAHNHTAKAVEFFQRMATKWGNHPNIIYEIFNEPIGYQARTATKPAVRAVTWAQIEGYSDTVIAAIRAIDSANLILVGNPNWDQVPTAAVGSILSKYSNLAYTLHFYAGTHGEALRMEGDDALAQGLALFISEWGTTNADGGTVDSVVYKDESALWLDWAKDNNLSWCNWSVVNKAEASAAFLPSAGSKGWWHDSVISISGLWVRDQIRKTNQPFNYVHPDPPPPDKPDTASIPGRLQAEGFVTMAGIQSESGADVDGSDNIGYIEAGDWADYVVNSTGTGPLYFHARVASNGAGGNLVLRNAAGEQLASVRVDSTGGWQKWVTVVDSHSQVNLPAGLVRLRLSFEGTGTRSLYNLNWVELKTEIDPVSVGRPRTVGSWKMIGNELNLSGLDKNWSTVAVRDVRGQLVANRRLTDGAARIRLTGKGIFFAEIAGPQAREVRKLLVGN